MLNKDTPKLRGPFNVAEIVEILGITSMAPHSHLSLFGGV